MVSSAGFVRLEVFGTGCPAGHRLPPPCWPSPRVALGRWRGAGCVPPRTPLYSSRVAVGRLVPWWSFSPPPTPSDSFIDSSAKSSSGGPRKGRLTGLSRTYESYAAEHSERALEAHEDWARSTSGNGNGSGDGDAVSQQEEHHEGAAHSTPSTAAASGRGAGGGITPGSARDLLRSTLNAINVLQGPLNTTETLDEDAMYEDHLIEHGLAAPSMGRAVYEVLRIDQHGKRRRIYVKRRDMLRSNGLLPRDLRRIDPSLSVTKTSPSISIKEHVLLINLGGVRLIIAADHCLLLEPNSVCSRKFLDLMSPRLAASDSHRRSHAYRKAHPSSEDADYAQETPPPPFELEILEGALMVSTGRLDAELLAVTRRVSNVLRMLPKDITPVNLEELRRVKQLLVELESKADTLRDTLEELMDDEDEIRDMNLSSRPAREDRRKQRDRERLAREMERGDEQRARASAEAGMSTLEWSSNSGWEMQEKNSRWSFDGEEGRVEAESALEEMEAAEAEEREVEEVEDLLEYYMQRAATTQSESERLLAGARDLEESIGVSLSARRFEVNRLELTLSIGSFAAALGAVVAGIFGMNLRSTCEESVVGFWGCTGAIIVGCVWVFVAIYKYMRHRRIL